MSDAAQIASPNEAEPIAEPDLKSTNQKTAAMKIIGNVSISDLSRKPGFMEDLFLYLEQKKLFCSVGIAFKMSTGLEITPSFMFLALRELVLKYPLLFMISDGQEPNFRWKPLDKVLFHDVFQIIKADTPVEEMFDCLSVSKQHKLKKPLWRLTFYENSRWLVFQSAHSFTDGASIVAYLKEIVANLNLCSSNGELEKSICFGKNELDLKSNAEDSDAEDSTAQEKTDTAGIEEIDAEALETNNGLKNHNILFSLENDLHLLETGVSLSFFDKIMFMPNYKTRIATVLLKTAVKAFPFIVPTFLETWLRNSYFVNRLPVPFSSRSFFENDHVISERSPLISAQPHFINIEPRDLALVLASCRAHRVKLQTYTVFVYLQTVQETSSTSYLTKFLKAGVAVSMRNVFRQLKSHNSFLDTSERFDDGFYTYLVKYYIEPGTRFSWANAKKYHDYLHETIFSSEWINSFYAASHALSAESYMGPKMEFERDDCFLFSTNLGQVEVAGNVGGEQERSGKQGGQNVLVEDILFAPNCGATLGLHHMTMCSTKKSGLNIGFSEGDTTVGDWEKFSLRLGENFLSLHEME